MRQSGDARWIILAAALTFGLGAGCRDGSTPAQPPPSGTPAQGQAAPGPAQGSDVDTTPVEEPPPPPTIPEVLLIEADRETCLVGVDDPMPDAELVDLDGQGQSLGELQGEKLTVVLFWTIGSSEFSSLAAQTVGSVPTVLSSWMDAAPGTSPKLRFMMRSPSWTSTV